MILDPHIAQVMLKNPKLRQLIPEINHDRTTTSIGVYKFSERRPSFYADINQETGVVDLFRPTYFLGQGRYAHVRLFSNKHGISFAVKTPHAQRLGTSNESITSTLIDYQQEHTIMRRAYNNHNACKLFYFAQGNEHGKITAKIRSVMPHIQGEQVHTYIQRIQSPHTLALIILSMTKTVMRLHENNIIHGDIKLDNIIISTVPDLKTTLVDFGFAYWFTEETASTFLKEESANYIAPERCNYPRDVTPHTNQDVYSFAYNIKYHIINMHPQGDALKNLYPCLNDFTQDGCSPIPELRPNLTSLCEALSYEIQSHHNDAITTPTMRI